MVPHTHAAEGTLRLGFFDNVPGPEHPFRLINSDGGHIALYPNDGCGFLRFDVAMTIAVVRDHVLAWPAVRTGQASAEQQALVNNSLEPKRLAPQAMQHFPRDQSALKEAHEAMCQCVAHLAPTIDSLNLYTYTTSGGYRGEKIRAIPSANDNVYLPEARSAAFDAHGGALLIGKAPYDKENLLTDAAERVVTPAAGDATARFLSECFAIQYSYTGFNDEAEEAKTELLHSKGMLVIPLPGCWSPAHSALDMACSKEDLKTLSRWTNGRERASTPNMILSTGSLRVKEFLFSGRLGALPIDELRKRAMDTDGDDAFIYAGYPRLAALIERVMAERNQRRGEPRSFKPPKTAPLPGTVRLVGIIPAAQLRFSLHSDVNAWSQPPATCLPAFSRNQDDIRSAMAREMLFGTYEGIEKSLRNGLYDFLGDASCDLSRLQEEARPGIERDHLSEARTAAELLHAQIKALSSNEASAEIHVNSNFKVTQLDS